VRENLEFFGSFYGVPDLPQRIREVCDMLELRDRLEMKVGKLSKGLKQRTALARILVPEPRVLFLDEPTSGLDPIAAKSIRDLIVALGQTGITIFLNSHNLEEVQKICHRVAILDNGGIRSVGTPALLESGLWQNQEISVSFASPYVGGLSTIESINGVEQVHLAESGRELAVQVMDVLTTTPEIIRSLVNAGASILEVRKRQHTLEDTYLRLMGDQEGNHDD
jgi:ABC-2 type transport system ATP-binding protein